MIFSTTLSTAGVLNLASVTGGYPHGVTMLAKYTAVATGQVDVSTDNNSTCTGAPPACPTPLVTWTIHITVISFP